MLGGREQRQFWRLQLSWCGLRRSSCSWRLSHRLFHPKRGGKLLLDGGRSNPPSSHRLFHKAGIANAGRRYHWMAGSRRKSRELLCGKSGGSVKRDSHSSTEGARWLRMLHLPPLTPILSVSLSLYLSSCLQLFIGELCLPLTRATLYLLPTPTLPTPPMNVIQF